MKSSLVKNSAFLYNIIYIQTSYSCSFVVVYINIIIFIKKNKYFNNIIFFFLHNKKVMLLVFFNIVLKKLIKYKSYKNIIIIPYQINYFFRSILKYIMFFKLLYKK